MNTKSRCTETFLIKELRDEDRTYLELRYGPLPDEMMWVPVVEFFNRLPLEFRLHHKVSKAWALLQEDYEWMLLQLINFENGCEL